MSENIDHPTLKAFVNLRKHRIILATASKQNMRLTFLIFISKENLLIELIIKQSNIPLKKVEVMVIFSELIFKHFDKFLQK